MQKLKSTKYLGMGAVVIGASLLATIGAKADPITIYGTGQDNAGLALADGTVDSHYTLTTFPVGSTPNAGPTGPTTYAIANNPAWLANTPTGNAGTKWIGYNPNNANGGVPTDPGTTYYTYTTTFDLTGLDANSASLTGSWAVDNQGLNILLNGNSTGFTSPDYTALTPFNITSGFQAGVNTLSFVVRNFNDSNGDSPTGLRANVSGTANAAAVPEPGTMSLMALGLASLAAAKRRKKQNEEASADDSI